MHLRLSIETAEKQMVVINNAKLRKFLKYIAIFALPSVMIVGGLIASERAYVYVVFALSSLSLLIFLTGFDNRKIGSRRAVTVAIMTVLCTVGRFIPFFKPVTALTILCSIYLGCESGFAVGAFAALVSGIYFGMGPWLPFQMTAWGSIGFISGLCAPLLKKSKIFRYLFSVLCGVVFSLIMDIWTVLWYSDGFDFSLYLAATVTAIPTTVVYCISNVLFLALFYKPFSQKLERIKTKYGI